ncbi:MAG TPA: DUF2975 domain-containing protein [Candidatus Bacteroides pullicola]|uniref:DUF2975 domain-containing protein n=1 Tax=Candidatus Bacteroides pullicola TaxID=2838475 RepID=A0A9D1ZJ99_9BACE|nr:DUF2975 domain-containing protein [Candidatus Bacteroides pullicola]
MTQKNKVTQKRERNLIALLSGFCAFVFMSSTFRNITLSYELGKDDTGTFIWQMIPESVALLLMAFCAGLVIRMLYNLKHKRIFIPENVRLVQYLGLAVLIYGVFLSIWKHVSPVETVGFMRDAFLLLGGFILLIGSVFKAGIRMKEEQDLTI